MDWILANLWNIFGVIFGIIGTGLIGYLFKFFSGMNKKLEAIPIIQKTLDFHGCKLDALAEITLNGTTAEFRNLTKDKWNEIKIQKGYKDE